MIWATYVNVASQMHQARLKNLCIIEDWNCNNCSGIMDYDEALLLNVSVLAGYSNKLVFVRFPANFSRNLRLCYLQVQQSSPCKPGCLEIIITCAYSCYVDNTSRHSALIWKNSICHFPHAMLSEERVLYKNTFCHIRMWHRMSSRRKIYSGD